MNKKRMANKENKMLELAIQQNLLLWELTHSMLDIEKLIEKSSDKSSQKKSSQETDNS